MKKLMCAVLLALFVGGVVGCSGEKAPADNTTKKAPDNVTAPK